MDMIYEIRRRYLVQKQIITAIAREMGLSRPTVRKHLQTVEEPKCKRKQPSAPKLGQHEEQLMQWLIEDAQACSLSANNQFFLPTAMGRIQSFSWQGLTPILKGAP